MYRKSAEVRRKAAIHKLLDNGHRYGVLLGETVIFSCRYDYRPKYNQSHETTTSLQIPVKTKWSTRARYEALRWGMSFCIQ